MLRQMREIFVFLCLLLRKMEVILDITSKVWLYRAGTNGTACFRTSATLLKRNILRIERQSSDIALHFEYYVRNSDSVEFFGLVDVY